MKDNKTFQKNIELWSKTCPKQAVMLPYTNTDHLNDCPTQLGEPNLQINQDKKTFMLHSSKGAAAEAKQWFDSLDLSKVPLIMTYGVGLGYYYDAAETWLKKSKKHRLVFLEDDLAVIYKLFGTERGARILKNNQVQLLYFEDLKSEVFEALYWNFALSRLAVTALQSYFENKPECLAELRHKIAYDAAMKNALVDEYVRYGVGFYLNYYQDLLLLPNSYQGSKFFGKFSKVPAIICGAGPSLEKNLPLLKTLLDKAVVFAGGSALNVLNAADFQPNFGAGIDPNPAQFERLSSNQGYEVPFFYRNRMYHEAFKMIHGPRLYIPGSGGYDTAEFFDRKFHIHEEFLDEGHNVVNFCVEVAHAMGCDPIIFVGMDLAFTGMNAYSPGVLTDAKVEQSAILDVDNEDDKAFIKDDVFGKPTYTLWKWVAESEWIGDYAKTHPNITMVNSTEGGLGFPGILNLPLADVAKKYLHRQYEFKNRIHGETQNSQMTWITLPKIIRAMKELQKSLHQSIEHFQILVNDNICSLEKLKNGETSIQQSGLAALAETELADEIGYKHVIEVFNEVYSRILSGEMHQISIGRHSEKQRLMKKLKLGLKKFAFLRNVAQLNEELISHAFREHKKPKLLSKAPEINIKKALKGSYQFEKKKFIIHDPELDISIEEVFDPLKVPKKPKDGQILLQDHILRVFFDNQWKLSEAYVDYKGKPNGQCLLYYSDGSIKEEVFYKEGKLHGPATFWNPEGVVLARSWFIKGQQQGKLWWYYPSGMIYSLQRFKNDVWHGRQEFFYEDGSVKSLLDYKQGHLISKPYLKRIP